MIGRQQAGQSGSRNCRRIQTGAVLAMIAVCLCWTQPGRAQTYVDLEPVLALDASPGIAGDEFELQIKGYADIAEAIRRKLLREISAPIAFAEPPTDPG